MELRFIRDTDKREIDFVVLKEGQPLFVVESRSSEKNINPALYYFMERTPIPKFYQVHKGRKDFEKTVSGSFPFKYFARSSVCRNLMTLILGDIFGCPKY